MVRIDDLLAALLLTLVMLRRLEVLRITREDNPRVSEQDFERWKRAELGGYKLAAIACFGKVVLSLAWFSLVQVSPWLQIGGATIFAVWVIALVSAWRTITDARGLRGELGIGRPPTG